MALPEHHVQLTFRDYGSIIWRRKWVVLYPILLTALVAGVLSFLAPVKYRSAAEVLVQLPPTAESVGSTGAVMSPRLIENELRAASGSELQAEVRKIIGPEPILSVSADEGSDVFRFLAVSGGRRQAGAAANAYAEMYIERQRAKLISEYSARAEVIAGQLARAVEASGSSTSLDVIEYEQELESLNLSIELARTSGSTLIDEARTAGAPFEPRPRRAIAFGAMLGLLIGLGVAFLLEYLDTSIRGEDELSSVTGLPTLATIPVSTSGVQLVARDDQHSPAAEAYRSLRTAVQFLTIDRTIKIIQVTSPHPGEGKSTTAANLAYVAANAGRRVVLVDCDLRKPQIQAIFGLSNEGGFTSVMLKRISLKDALWRSPDEPKLNVLVAGPAPPNPSELLSADRAVKLFESLAGVFDLIVIDSPPVLPVADAAVLAGLADGVIVVVGSGTTERRTLAKTLDRLSQVDAQLLGTVLNRHDPQDGVDYAYTYTTDNTETMTDSSLELDDASSSEPATARSDS
jgi:non-specific protein-tyrosine kinase